MIGAYILAGELSESPEDIPAALSRYQTIIKEPVSSAQKIILGAPGIANPQSQLGLYLLKTSMTAIAWLQKPLQKLMPMTRSTYWKPPRQYPKLQQT